MNGILSREIKLKLKRAGLQDKRKQQYMDVFLCYWIG